MNCSDPVSISALALMVAFNHTWSASYNCVDFSYAFGNVMKENGCQFRMVTGWNAKPGTPGRVWHRWIQTPDFFIEPQNGRINPSYDMRYFTAWNWSHRYGK